jgi:predicted nicotinamide N-methyase
MRSIVEEAKNSDKHSREGFGVTILKKSHDEIRRLGDRNHHPSIHGHKFWRTSYLLMDYLSKSPPVPLSKIIEVGCGWGLTGIYCAKTFGAQVTSVDADADVFPYLQTHARINKVRVNTLEQRFEHLTTNELTGFDLLIGSEICFWDTMENSVFDLIKKAKDSSVNKILIADPGRPPFMNLVQRCKKTFNARLLEWYTREPKWVYGHILLI